MSRDTLTVFADAVMQQIRDAGTTAGDGSFLISLPAYYYNAGLVMECILMRRA